jgi:hypothetical protein
MANARKAAISPDELGSTPLRQLDGEQFVQLLNHRDVSSYATIVSDKKKYELWVEENLGGITVADFLDKIRGEKKKIELEKFKIENIVLKRVVEDPPDPRQWLVDPIVFEQIVERLDRLEEKLAKR